MTLHWLGLRKSIGLAAIVLAMAPGPVLAQEATSGAFSGLTLSGKDPIQIESDRLEVVESESKAVFTGNVNVTQGPTLMKSGKMTVYYVKSAAEGSAAPATGSSNIDRLEVDDKVYIKSEDQVATGDRGVFDMKTEILVLSGSQVVLSQGTNVLVGCKLTADMRTGRAQVEGCKTASSPSGRVMMSITPGSQNQ